MNTPGGDSGTTPSLVGRAAMAPVSLHHRNALERVLLVTKCSGRQRMDDRAHCLNIAVAGAGWNLVAQVQINARGIAAIDLVVEKASTSSEFHVAKEDLPTGSLNGPPVYGIHDRENELMLIFASPEEPLPRRKGET
jgi:hypothetical protein